MDIIHGVFVYVFIVNVCVVARGGHGGHGGSHGSHGSYGSHGHSSYHGSHGHHVTASHTHYTYHPPRHVMYTCRHCSSTEMYPVYRPMPPTYVYMYKESGSRYADILTGLSLYNLGRSTSMGWARSHEYYAQPGERCSLQIIERSHFEETEFPCFMISSFVESTVAKGNDSRQVDISSSKIDVKPFLKDNGPALQVTNEQECVLWHNLTMHKERNHVPCALLKEYANTVRQSGVPTYIWLPTLLGTIIAIYLCCACFCRKKEKETVKEEAPLNELRVQGYCSNY